MELTVIGSGTGHPSLTRGSPALLLTSGGTTVLFDCGGGTVRGLFAAGCSCETIDALVCSHLHPDHTLDLITFLFTSKIFFPRTRPLAVIGPAGMGDFYRRVLELYDHAVIPGAYELTLSELSGGSIPVGELIVTAYPVMHTANSIALRARAPGGATMAYSGDTDYCQGLIDACLGADLAVLECSFPDERCVDGHLCPRKIARVARETGCRRLVLTHLYPVCEVQTIRDQLAREGIGDVMIASDLFRCTV